jgi:hypothetical protein
VFPTRSWVELLRQIKKGGLPPSPARRRERVLAARRQISNDRQLGEGRSARTKCHKLRRDKNQIEIAEILDC